MAGSHVYTDYHPRWLRQRVSTYWWLQKASYFAFILREATCFFVAWAVVYLLLLVNAVRGGAGRYAEFLAASAAPGLLTVNVISFFLLTYHAVTFFQAAPQAMVVHARGRRVPPQLVLAGHYAAWGVISLALWWVLSA